MPTLAAMKPSSRFLLAGLAAAATTANAIRPARAAGPLSVPAFAFGLTPSELPLQTGLLQLATGALLARSAAARGAGGAPLGLAAYAASVAGLVHLHRVASEAGDVLEAALVDELGADYRSRITRAVQPAAPRSPLTRQQLLRPDMRRAQALPRRPQHQLRRRRACATTSTCGSGPTSRPTPRRRCCSRSTAARG